MAPVFIFVFVHYSADPPRVALIMDTEDYERLTAAQCRYVIAALLPKDKQPSLSRSTVLGKRKAQDTNSSLDTNESTDKHKRAKAS